MLRALLSAALAAGLVTASVAQDKTASDAKPATPKKQKSKGPPRVAVADPAQAKDAPDFAVQGEYEGELKAGDNPVKVGVQVIAQGGGKFQVRAYKGGLPGAGWDGDEAIPATAERAGGKVVVRRDDREVGSIADGTLTVNDTEHGVTGTLKRVERASPTLGAKPPEGAVVLWGGPDDVAKWAGGNVVELSDGKFLGVGEKSKQAFGPMTAHIEFRLPWMPNSRGQGRGNSGVYVQDRYEIQVLDSFGLSGENNECGGVYTQHKPSVNMCLPPLQWQTYDIDFTPAQFAADGKKTANARLTLKHNGVVVHDNVELPQECPGGQKEAPTPGPFQFQNHGDPVVYRNVWVAEKK